MKNKIIYSILISFLITSVAMSLILFQNNQKLNQTIAKQNSLINNVSYRDSIYAEKTKKYSEVITKYVSDCEFQIDNKKIPAKEMVELFNSYLTINEKLTDSIGYYKLLLKHEKENSQIYEAIYKKYLDSTYYYKLGYNTAQKQYGVKYDLKINDNVITLKSNFSKVDSALLIFPYYRDKLKKDSITGQWIITYESKVSNNKNDKRKK